MIWLAVTAGIITVLGCGGVWYALTRAQQPMYAIPAVIAILLAIGLFFAGPTISEGMVNKPPINIGPAKFKDFYEKNITLLGEPIEEAKIRDGVWVQYFTYGRLEYHPEITEENWQHQLGNVAQEYMVYADVKPDPNPVVPKAIALYLADQGRKGMDPWRTVGIQLTNPRMKDGVYEVWFQKGILTFPASQYDGVNDPAAVQRLPIGKMLWIAEKTKEPLDAVWTTSRLYVLAASVMALALAFLPKWFPPLRQDRIPAAF